MCLLEYFTSFFFKSKVSPQVASNNNLVLDQPRSYSTLSTYNFHDNPYLGCADNVLFESDIEDFDSDISDIETVDQFVLQGENGQKIVLVNHLARLAAKLIESTYYFGRD